MPEDCGSLVHIITGYLNIIVDSNQHTLYTYMAIDSFVYQITKINF